MGDRQRRMAPSGGPQGRAPSGGPEGRAAAQAAELALDGAIAAALRTHLPEVAETVVAAIIDEVPAYSQPFRGRMGRVIEQAVHTSLDSFLDAATRGRPAQAGEETPIGVGVQAARELGRVEADAGRPIDALLAAYRVGARVSWREISRMAVAEGADAGTLGRLAEVVFTYIDELSAASVAGHNAETQSAERARSVNLDRLTRALLAGAGEPELADAAELARWVPPRTLTAVLVGQERLLNTAAMLDPRTLTLAEELPAIGPTPPDGVALLLVPDAGGAARTTLLEVLAGRDAIVGPAQPWQSARRSYRRALRGLTLPRDEGVVIDTEEHLPAIVLSADRSAVADLREATLSPFADLPEATADRLAETLRAWLLLQGRRELVAESLHVHPQTVRYRMGQVRELFGERLQDPDEVLALLIALSAPR